MKRLTDALRQAAAVDESVGLSMESLANTGEALCACRLTAAGDPPRTWVAKRLHPSLRRESAVYRGPLANLNVAPRLVTEVAEKDGSLWIILEDAGWPLAHLADEPTRREAASLAARIHAVPAASFRRGFWRTRVHVRHGMRHLRGEWKIALHRIEAAVQNGALDAAVAPSPAEAREVLEEAWAAMEETVSGLVHGDFQASNILRAKDGTLRAVDWSQWGEGSYLLDLASLTVDQDETGREQILAGYARARGQGEAPAELRRGLDRVLPLRQLLGVGVLAHYAVHGLQPELTADSFPRRLAAWDAVRPRERVR